MSMTMVNGWIDRSLKVRLERIAKQERRSLSNLVTLFLERGVYTHESKKKSRRVA